MIICNKGKAMKKLNNDIFFKTILLFLGLFIVLFIVSYALSKHFILSLVLSDTQSLAQTLEAFNLVWMKITLVFIVLMLGAYFILKYLQKRVYEDVESLSEYIYEISENKNYTKPLKIQHYLEFLQIAVSLKNITKRLAQKDRKTDKK